MDCIKVADNLVVFPDCRKIVARIYDQEMQKLVAKLPDIKYSADNLYYEFPWTTQACKILQNMGFDALPAMPFMRENDRLVEGKYSPMRHQLLSAAFMILNPRGYNLAEPRLGKTSSTIIGADYMQRNGMITGGVLIITTLTTIHGVWKASIESTVPGALIGIVHGKTRRESLERVADFYITNYESCRLNEKDFIKAIQEKRIGAVVIDELTHVGNSGSKRHKAIYNICNKSGVPHVWGLTGSPADNPEMVYGMCRCVNQTRLPCTTKSSWLDITMYQYGPEPYMKRPSAMAPDIIHKSMQPAIRFSKANILDLPPVTTQIRTCDLSGEQKKRRAELKDEAVSILESGAVITAANGGVLLTKLMQVALGIVKDENGSVHELDHKSRTDTILEAIAETQRKIVIFCGYIAGIDMLVREFRNAGLTCEKVDGSVTGQKRSQILYDFQNKQDPHVLVCHPTTTAMGVELSAADTLIFNGVPLTGGFVYAQSIERLSSTKQTADNINIIHIISTPEERKALDSLRNGYDLGQRVASMFEEFAQSA